MSPFNFTPDNSPAWSVRAGPESRPSSKPSWEPFRFFPVRSPYRERRFLSRSLPHVGYVPQIETVDWDFPVTVEQVVAMGLYRESSRLPWLTRPERARIQTLLEQLGIGSYAQRHIKALSGGEQQRVFLARALIGNPKLLILDEPTSGVDLKTQHAILHLLGELNRGGVTILLTTHDLNAVARHLPWVICFNQTIIAQGYPEEIFTSAILSRTYDSEMSVVRQGDVILVDDSPKAGLHFKKQSHSSQGSN
ncbi:MAG: ATP-binding cassette domain-containing protein [Candidatus Manganitrophus sp.]|nr:ATP-binding cassette domain-containing protein [Candidatus Manganitrophus sp.]